MDSQSKVGQADHGEQALPNAQQDDQNAKADDVPMNEDQDGSKAGQAQVEEQAEVQLPDLTEQRLKDQRNNFRSQMRLQQEPVKELEAVMETLKAVAKHQDLVFKDKPDVEKFFFKEWLEPVVKTLATLIKITLNKDEFRVMVGQIPPLIAEILYNNISSKDVFEALASIFDHKSRIYQYHYLSAENAILTQSQAARENLTEEEIAWRESLKEGDEIEAIKIDPALKCKCWSLCTIMSIQNKKLRIKFKEESKTCDRDVDLWGPEIAPCGERSKEDEEFRAHMTVGQRVDCYDGTNLWYAAIILKMEVREFQGEKLDQVEIAFRVPHPNGDKTDKQGNKYFGWEEDYDEWMPARSARIAPYQKYTTDALENQTSAAQNSAPASNKASEDVKVPQVDDSMDALVEYIEGQRIYAVQRRQCRSDLLIDFLNTFGRMGGFGKLVERMVDFGPEANEADELNFIGVIIDSIAKCACVLHQGVVNEYLEQFERAAVDKIMKATNRQQRSTSKEVTDEIIDKLYKEILPRLASRDAAGLFCDRHLATLDIGVLFLAQDFLGRRVDGVKLINDVAFQCLRVLQQPPSSGNVVSATQAENYERKLLMVDQAVARLKKDGEVLRAIFSKESTHLQLVQRTEQLLRLLMVKGQLGEEWRQLVWQASLINDGEMKVDLYKVLIGASADMQKEDRLFFIERVLSIPKAEIIDREVELVAELCTALRGRQDCEDIAARGLDFIWSMALGSDGDVPVQVVNRALIGLSDILRARPIDKKIEYADKLAALAKDVKQGFLIVKIFAKFLKLGFDGKTGHPEIENLSDMIDYLENKHQLYNSIFEHLISYMGEVAAQIDAGKFDVKDDPQTKVIHGMYAHCDQITQRLEFIKFYAESSSKVSISSDQLNILWEQLALKSPIDQDRKQIYQWLKEVCDIFLSEREKQGNENSKKGQSIVTLDDLMSFYREKMLRGDEDDVYKDLSLEGFHCIQSFFVLLNGISGKLIRITENYGQYKGKHLAQPAQDQQPQAKPADTGSEAAAVSNPSVPTAIEFNAKTQTMTSYSSTSGPGFNNYSWTSKDNTAVVSTGTGTGVMHGPWKKSPVDGYKQQEDKKDKEIDPEDLTIEVLVPPNELEGYKILWRLATESRGKEIIDAAAKLLVQMHHNVHSSLEHRMAEFDEMFISQCFEITNKQKPAILARTEEEKAAIQEKIDALPARATTIMQLRARPVQERRIVRSLFLLKQLIKASEKNGTHDLRPHESLSGKSIQLTALQIQNNITHGDQYRTRVEISIGDQATLWDLKKRIGIELAMTTQDGGKTYALHPGPDGKPTPPIHPAVIRLFQMRFNKDIKDPLNGVTLKELKFESNESLGIFRRSAYHTRRGPIVVDNEKTGEPELTQVAERAVSEIFNEFSEISEKTGGQRMMTQELCIEFTHKVTKSTSSIDDPRVIEILKKFSVDSNAAEKMIDLNGLKRFCINSCTMGKEETLRNNFRTLGYAQDLKRFPKDGEPDNILQLRKSKEEMPRYKVALNEHYFDSLIELLQYDPEVASRAREVIATLATQPFLYSVVSKLEFASSENKAAKDDDEPPSPSKFDWSSIFDSDNVNKMLYSLEIVSAILVGYSDTEKSQSEIVSNMVSWVTRFIELRGLQELQRQLSSALAKVQQSQQSSKSYEKKLVDQLLQLIRMFVMSASEGSSPEEGKTEPKANNEKSENEKEASQQIQETPAGEASGGYETPKKKKAAPITTSVGGNFENITQAELFGEDEGANATQDDPKKEVEDNVVKLKSASNRDDSLQNLKEVMKQDGLAAKVLELIDCNSILKQMTQLIELILDSGSELQKEDRHLIESALNLWAQLAKGEATKGNKPHIDKEFILRGLIKVDTFGVRVSFQENYQEIAKQSKEVAEQLFEILFNSLKNIEELSEYTTKQGRRTMEYFKLLCALIPIVGADKPDLLCEVVSVCINCSYWHQTTETSDDYYIDSTRVGLFKMISAVLDLYKKDDENKKRVLKIISDEKLIDHVHRECLFYYGSGNDQSAFWLDSEKKDEKNKEEAPKKQSKQCHTNDSRKAAYQLLNDYQACLEPKEMGEYLQQYIMPLVKDVERPKKWKHLPSSKGRVHGHCGLVNLGCICYMISMLQQFYLVPQFRYQLLKAEDNEPEKLEEWRGEMIDDNLLKQLRRLFGFLELSARHAYDPKPFCYSFKEFDGGPTKIGEQKDSQEFLNIFFDRLENQMKPTSQRYLLRDVFAGNQCTQLICSNCGKVKNRMELFYNLSLQVKGSNGIYDSLSQLAKGQTIDDYTCDFCQQRTKVTRRQLIADTPNTLIVHLQRIVFSFDTFQNDKVNDRFEFPQILDLKDYSFKERLKMEGLDLKDMNAEENVDLSKLNEIHDDDYLYRLVGVNVHVGTADRGHYYSLINLKRGANEPEPYGTDEKGNSKFQQWSEVSKDNWKVFDDSVVRHFNFDKDLKSESFGESPNQNEAGDRKSDAMTDAELAQFLSTGGQTYGKSAYMLVYERKSKKNVHEVVVDDKGQEEVKELEYRSIPKYVPDWIEKEVTDDNKNFYIDAQMFHDDFFSHVKTFLKQISNDLVMQSHRYNYEYSQHITNMKKQALKVGGKILFDMQCYYDHNVQICDIGSSLESLMIFCDSPFLLESGEKSLLVQFLNDYLLDDSLQHFFKIMFTCTSITSRKYAGVVAAKAVSRLIRIYNDCKPELRETVDGIKEVKETYTKIIDLCMVALMDKECQRNSIKLESFFKFLSNIATSSISAAQHFLERSDAISDLIDFMLGNASPRVTAQTEKRVAMGGTTPPPFQPLFTMVSFLVNMTHTAQMEFDQRLPTHVNLKIEGNYEQYKSFFLQEEAIVMLTATDWLEKVIYDQKYLDDQNKEFSKAMAHLSYKNIEFSKLIIGKILKSISFANDEGILALLNILEQLALVKDEFQMVRLEYIYGYGFLMHAKDIDDTFIYGRQLQEVRTSQKDIYQIVSSLDSRIGTDGIIHLLWTCHTRFDNRSLACIQNLLNVVNADEDIAEFISKIPPYDYNMARFTDFIRHYLGEKMVENDKYKTAMGYKEKVEQLTKLESALDQYDLYLKKQLEKEEIIQHYDYIQVPQQPYIILKTEKEEEPTIVHEQVIDEAVSLKVVQVGAYWITSKPIGKGMGNLSLPDTVSSDIKELNQTSQPDPQAQPSENIQDPNVKAQYEQMQESLGMSKEDPKFIQQQPPSGDKEPQDEEMIVDAVVDANPVVGHVVAKTVHDSYPDSHLCKDLLYRVMLTNLTEGNVKVDIQFKQKKKDKKLNLAYPIGGLVDFLKPSLTGTLITLPKIDPSGDQVDFDDLEIKLTQSAHGDNAFQMNQFASQSDIPNTQKGKNATGQQSNFRIKPENIKEQRRNAVSYDSTPNQKSGDVGVGEDSIMDVPKNENAQDSYVQASVDDIPTAFPGQKACPICTFLNAVDNLTCEMCGSAF